MAFNNSHSKYLFLLYILMFNINIFLHQPISKLYYFPLIILIFGSALLSFLKRIENKTNITKPVLYISLVLLFFLFIRFNIYSYLAHYIYLISFILFISYLYFDTKIKIPPNFNIKRFEEFLNLTILS